MKKHARFALAALLFAPLFAGAQEVNALPRPDPAVAEFARGVKFTVAGYNGGSEVQTNFPVLVRLSTAITGFKYSDFYNDGSLDTDNDGQPNREFIDIGFVDAEGNGLAYEVDTWNPSGESLVWVNLPRMTNGTEFAMWYRSSKTGKELNADNVWADYTGVWHLNESGSGGTVNTPVKDSSTNALNGTAQGQAASVSAGKIGGSWRIATVYNRVDASILVELSDAVKNAKVNELGDTFSASFWMQRKNLETKWCVTGINRRPDGSTAGWGTQIDDPNTRLRIYANGGKNQYVFNNSVMTGLNTANQWGKVDVVWYNNNGTIGYKIYWNGVSYNVNGNNNGQNIGNNPTTPIVQPSGEPLVIGNFTSATSDRAWSGELDEVRLIQGVPSDARVKADYDTVNTPAFLTAGTVVEVAVVERPVANLQVVDTGASHVQFGNAISSLGSSDATECAFNVKVWKTAQNEPAGYTALSTGLTVGALSGVVKGLTPETAYSYKIKVTNDEGVDSDEVSGSFTTSGVGVGGTGGDMTRVGDDWIHYFRVGFDDQGGITNAYVFTPPSYATSVRALVVAGGGPGGYYAGGGGGAGGFYDDTLAVTPGTGYSIQVGAGGVAATSATAYGSNGGDSSIVGGTVNVVMLGGGAGGNGRLDNQTATRAGQNGGSGGGTAWTDYATGSGTTDQGNDGGTVPAGQYQQDFGAGGGGASAAGGSVEYSSSEQNKGSGTGGNGRTSDITGESLTYAGGGSGGGKLSSNQNGTGTAGKAGNGGGGKGGQYDKTEGSQYASAGTDGLGGGGGGGSSYSDNGVTYYQGGNGGDGIVIIRYAAQGDGTDVAAPAIALESLDRAANGLTTVGYRVAWAGAGYDDADVAIVWGFRKDDLSNTNTIASSKIGRGTGTFTLPDQTKTVYVRALATNAGGLSSLSPKTVKIPFVDPLAPEVALPAVSGITGTGASFSVVVLGLGEGATSVNGVFQVSTSEDFDGTILSFPAEQALTAAGSLTATATDLAPNTPYYVRVSATNDVPAVFETDPVAFRTGIPGAPSGLVITDNPPAGAAVPAVTTTTIDAWGQLTTPGDNGATYANLCIEASTSSDFASIDATSTTSLVSEPEGCASFSLTGLQPGTDYYLRLRMENNGRVVAYSAVVGPYTTLAEPKNDVQFLIY